MLWKLKGLVLQHYRFQGDLARDAGFREDRLSRIIHGRTKPTREEMERIASALQLPVQEVFGLETGQ
jgi:transcriptional regulator with XRE-family HTH domain